MTYGNRSIAESCEIRELIAAASEEASTATEIVGFGSCSMCQADRVAARAVSYEARVLNLITNALEAMLGGGEIRIGVRKTGNYVLVEIEDTGPGIPHDIRDRVFERFVTAGKANGLVSGWPYPARLFSTTAARFGLSRPAVLVLSSALR